LIARGIHVPVAAGKGDAASTTVAVAYNIPQRGGRVLPSGERIEWAVTFPRQGVPRGAIPFWCQDVTPRGLRVPSGADAIQHGSRAVGIAELRLLAREQSAAAAYAEALGVVLGTEAVKEGGGEEYVLEMQELDGEGVVRVVVGVARAVERGLLEGVVDGAVIAEVVFRTAKGGELESLEENVGGTRVRLSFVEER
jgi:hypothetical protein